MSAWQFKANLLPASWLVTHFGRMPKNLDVIHFDESVPAKDLERRSEELPNYWETFDNDKALEQAIAKLLPERDSWSSLARMFGDSSKDSIEVWRREDGQLSRLTLSISLSEPNFKLIREFLECANRFNLAFLALQSRSVFEPSISSFIKHAENCSAARFIPAGVSLSSLLGSRKKTDRFN